MRENGEIPDFLYHATYGPYLESIKLKGLGAIQLKNWADSKSGVVYLANDKDVAESYAEEAEEIPDEAFLDDIILLEIEVSRLNKSLLKNDRNVIGNGGTFEYHGVIPPNAIKLV